MFHANQERVEVVSAIEQRIVLESDLSTSLQELLEILIVVVLVVLATKDQRHKLEIRDAILPFELTDVFESAEPAGDGASGQGFAVQCGDHSNHVHDFAAVAGGPGRNAGDIKLPVFQAEGHKAQPLVVGEVLVLV